MQRELRESTIRKLQERASNYRHSRAIREKMSKAKRLYSPAEVLYHYRDNHYNASKTDRALGQKPGYTYSYLRRLYERDPDLKAKLAKEKRGY